MTKKELIKALENYLDDACVICRDESGAWDNIIEVVPDGCSIAIAQGYKYENYERWLSDLEVLADIECIELHIDKYNYRTYFMRGYLPVAVIDDIKSLSAE